MSEVSAASKRDNPISWQAMILFSHSASIWCSFLRGVVSTESLFHVVLWHAGHLRGVPLITDVQVCEHLLQVYSVESVSQLTDLQLGQRFGLSLFGSQECPHRLQCAYSRPNTSGSRRNVLLQ